VAASYGKKKVGKVGKICQNEEMIGNDILRYQNMIKMKINVKTCNCRHVTQNVTKIQKNPKSPIGF
jgi:hypothetical protein